MVWDDGLPGRNDTYHSADDEPRSYGSGQNAANVLWCWNNKAIVGCLIVSVAIRICSRVLIVRSKMQVAQAHSGTRSETGQSEEEKNRSPKVLQ